MNAYRTITIGIALSAAMASYGFAKEVPFLSGRVNDTAGMLSPDMRSRLEKTLEELEQRTTAQIAVLTIDSLEGEVLESYSIKVAETWKLGQKGVDNGALFLISKNDRKMRIEVGYGLEASLTDLACKRILDDVVRPNFRSGDFDTGIQAGVDAVIGTIEGRPDAIPATSAGRSAAGQKMPLAARLFGFGLFAVVVGVFSLVALFGKGGQSWFMYVFLMPFYLLFPSGFIHPVFGGGLFLAWVVGFPVLKYVLAKTSAGKTFLLAHPGLANFAKSSGGSRSSGGSWSSGSSFSGGGGSFGGGGSSSSW